MTGVECQIDGCTSPKRARGWCSKHYKRWQTHGDPLAVFWERGNPEANFWAKVQRGDPGECWPFTGYITVDGYGQFMVRQVPTAAHRYAYQLAGGTIPAGLGIDHMCHNREPSCTKGSLCPHRRCVNPGHLVPATQSENSRRGRTGGDKAAEQAAKTHCPQGHPYDEANTILARNGVGNLGRKCRTCERRRKREAMALKRATPEGRQRHNEYMREHMRARRAVAKQQQV